MCLRHVFLKSEGKNRFWFMAMIGVTFFGLFLRLNGFELREATPDQYRLLEDALLRWEGYPPFFRDGYCTFQTFLWSIGFGILFLVNNFLDILSAGGATGLLNLIQSFLINVYTYPHLHVWLPRIINVLLASMLIPAVYMLTKELFDCEVKASFAALIAAISPLLLIYSTSLHSDSVQALTLTFSLIFALKSVRKESHGLALLSGILGGLGIASKLLALFYWLPMAITASVIFSRGKGRAGFMKFFGMLLMGAAVAYLIVSPYIASEFQLYIKSVYYRSHQFMGLAGFAGGEHGFWPLFVKYPLASLGIVGALAGFAGLILAIRNSSTRSRMWPLIVACACYIALLLFSKSIVSRYFITIAPILIAFAAHAGIESIKALQERFESKKALSSVVAVLIVLAILPAYGAFKSTKMLQVVDTRIEARAWIEENVPSGSTIVVGITGPNLVKNRASINRYHNIYEERITRGRLSGALGTEFFADAILSEEKHFYKVFSYLKLSPFILEPSYNVIDALYEPHDGSSVQNLEDYYVVCSGCMTNPGTAFGQSTIFYKSLGGEKKLLKQFTSGDGLSARLEIYMVKGPKLSGIDN